MARTKRRFDQYARDADNRFGVGQVVQNGQQSDADPARPINSGENDVSGADDWQVVGPSKNKRRKRSLKQEGDNYPTIGYSQSARLHSIVKLSDLQELALYLFTDSTAPQWCRVQHHSNVRKIVFLMVPGLESGIFDGSVPLTPTSDAEILEENRQLKSRHDQPEDASHHVGIKKLKISPDEYYPIKLEQDRMPAPLQPIGEMFPHLWPIKTPGDTKYSRMYSPIAAILTAPFSKTKESRFKKGSQGSAPSRGSLDVRTPITAFVASTRDLEEEGYVMHPAHYYESSSCTAEAESRVINKKSAADGWLDTAILTLSDGEVPDNEIEQGSVTAGRKVLSVDCEMCVISPLGKKPPVLALTRATVIDWNGDVVLDELVKPREPITDYVTQYSGITAAMLENISTTVYDVQQKLLSLITPQTILIGHSLKSDLEALKLTHPFVVDTALIFPHPRGPPCKESLRNLAKKYLHREIQKGGGSTGHDSAEDARTCLDLVKQKCERGKAWGMPEATGESIFSRLEHSFRPKRDKRDPDGPDEHYTSAVVDWGEPSRGHGKLAKEAIGCKNDRQVVEGIVKVLGAGADETSNPNTPNPDGCDFVWARFRELEAFRGWWNESKTADNDELRTAANSDNQGATLAEVLKKTVDNIQAVYKSLPKCTAFVVYSGSGDPRDLSDMRDLHNKYKEEYRIKNWNELSIRWTDREEEKLRDACNNARSGIGFITVK